jgi:catechol 2,3-dioxygenase-like lactoylglutathione lyase family enzyme
MRSRRDILKSTVGLTLVVKAARTEQAFHPAELNHVFLCVSDSKKSEAFYTKLFGPPARRLRTGSVLFAFGNSELGMGSIAGRTPGIDHFCIAVQEFTMEAAARKLKDHDVKSESLYAADEIYFRDPDGILVQLSQPNYHNPRAEPAPRPVKAVEPLFRPLLVNHIAMHVSDRERSTAFYEKLFGPAQKQAGRDLAGLRTASGQVIGWGTDLLSPVGIDHFCISVEGYEPDAASEKLRASGIASQRLYRPDQVFVRDPDGILVQLAGPDGGVRRDRP